MDRRAFAFLISSLAAAGTLPGFGGRAQAQSPEATGISAIDVHCHMFNATDLPIPGFVIDCYLSDIPPPIDLPVEFVVWLVSHMMDAVAMSADDEAKLIEQPAVELDLQVEPAIDDIVRSRVSSAVAQFQNQNYELNLGSNSMDLRIEKALRLVDRQMPTAEVRSAGLRRVASYHDAGLMSAPYSLITPDAVAAGALASASPGSFQGILRLAGLVTQRRLKLSQELANLPSSGASEVKFFAPAIIDYSYWLDDFDVSSLESQVRVMSDIAAIQGRPYAVHPWVSFCPWRQMVEPGQMQIVQDAVRNKGFVGVKLYPVMGFRPIGNGSASDKASYPPKLRQLRNWANRLDDALAKLYDWCVAEDVPILSHCSQSQTPSVAAGKRASPRAWDKVLSQSKWSNLRLDLAHLGGLWDLANPTNNGWTADLVPMLARHKNLYADLADYSSIMHRPSTTDQRDDLAIMQKVEKLLDADATGLARRKLMYGTDWVMLSISLDVGTYYPSMRDAMSADLSLSPQTFVGDNAARFLGLSKSAGAATPQTRTRLEAFYVKHGLDRALLAAWDTAAI